MRRIVLSVFFSVMAVAVATAQTDAKAKEVLEKAKKKFTSYKSVKMSFKETIKGSNLSESNTGYLVMKDGKLHLKNGDLEVVTDKKKTWNIQHSEKEITRDLYDSESSDFPTPDKIFDKYADKVKYLLIADMKVGGKLCHVVDIQPKKEYKDKFTFFKIRVFINKTDNSVSKYVISEKNGNSFHYEITKMEGNYTPSSTEFTVNEKAYIKKGYEVIKLDE